MKLGIALSGGGVRGAAHIGVLKALEESGIQVDIITGASIGSIVASLYAMGYQPDKMLEIFKFFAKEIMKTDTKYVFQNLKKNKSLFGYGLLSGENIEIAIQECAKEKQVTKITDITMPISLTTVDIISSQKCVFTNQLPSQEQEKQEEQKEHEIVNYITDARIDKAVRASSSYPLVFAPCEYQGYKFVDGGILDNIPAGEARKLGADKVITVKFAMDPLSNPKSMYEVAFKAVDILFEGRAKEAVRISDYVIDLDLCDASVFNIKKIDYCYQKGYEETKRQIEKIKQRIGKKC